MGVGSMVDGFTNMRSLNRIMTEAINLFDPSLAKHQDQTVYLAFMIARELGFDEAMQQLTMFSARVHDLGLVMVQDSESDKTENDPKEIAHMGANLVSKFLDPDPLPDIVRRSQDSWMEFLKLPDDQKDAQYRNARIASIVYLADTVSTMLKVDTPVLNQAKNIRSFIAPLRGSEFSEEAVDAFLHVTESESTWMDIKYHPKLAGEYFGETIHVPLNVAVGLTKDISLIVDYRSAFTATHSAGVAASATALARYAGMSSDECQMMQIAGNLHDLGKLKVPRSILDKPGRLTEREFDVIKEHPYFTYMILKDVEGFDRIARWAGFHHEQLKGYGYPFRYDAEMLDTGSRIMAVADIFAAITEVRPYRAGMNREQALKVLNDYANNGGIDSDLVALLNEHYEEVDDLRETAARAEGARYYESLTKEEIERLREMAAKAEGAGVYVPHTKEDVARVRGAFAKADGASYKGAMDVDYEQFTMQYAYITNLEKRFSHPFKLVVISLDAAEGEYPQMGELERSMYSMERSILQTIRNVDVLTRYGEQQFLVILLGTDLEGAKIAIDRIFKNYAKINGESAYTPTCFYD